MSEASPRSASSAPKQQERQIRRAFDEVGERLRQLMAGGKSLYPRCLDVVLDLVLLRLGLADQVPLDIYPGDEGGLSLVIHNVPAKRRLEVDVRSDGLLLSVCYIDENDRISRDSVESADACVSYLNRLVAPQDDVPGTAKAKFRGPLKPAA